MLIIRAATPSDISLIRELTLQIWPQSYSAILASEQIEYMLGLMYSRESLGKQMQEGHQFIIVYNEEVPVGFAAYSELEPSIFKLHKLYILSTQQGQGAGTFVINEIVYDVVRKGATALQLNVNRNNKAKLFYEKSGFKVIKTEDINIGAGYFMNDYVMEKKLKAQK